MTTYQKFKKLNIRHSAIGLEQSDTDVTYYCTPRDAAIIGWAGVDGIHYCTIPEFGEMIFAVSPMNFGDCVHPIAHSFEDLLRLLLSCGSIGVCAAKSARQSSSETTSSRARMWLLPLCWACSDRRSIFPTIWADRI